MKDPKISLASKDKAVRQGLKSSSSSRLTAGSRLSSRTPDTQESTPVVSPSENDRRDCDSPISQTNTTEHPQVNPDSSETSVSPSVHTRGVPLALQPSEGPSDGGEDLRNGTVSRMSLGSMVEYLMSGAAGKRIVSAGDSPATTTHQITRSGVLEGASPAGGTPKVEQQPEGPLSMMPSGPTIHMMTTSGSLTTPPPPPQYSARDTPVQVHKPISPVISYVDPSMSMAEVVELAMKDKSSLNRKDETEGENVIELPSREDGTGKPASAATQKSTSSQLDSIAEASNDDPSSSKPEAKDSVSEASHITSRPGSGAAKSKAPSGVSPSGATDIESYGSGPEVINKPGTEDGVSNFEATSKAGTDDEVPESNDTSSPGTDAEARYSNDTRSPGTEVESPESYDTNRAGTVAVAQKSEVNERSSSGAGTPRSESFNKPGTGVGATESESSNKPGTGVGATESESSHKPGTGVETTESESTNKTATEDRSSDSDGTSEHGLADRAIKFETTGRPSSRSNDLKSDTSSMSGSKDRMSESDIHSRPCSRDKAPVFETNSRPNSREAALKTDINSRPISRGKSSKSDATSRPSSRDRGSKSDSTSRPGSQDRSSASDANSRTSSRDRGSTPDGNSRPSSRDRASSSDTNRKPSSRDRGPTPDGNSRPSSRDRAPASDARSRPGSRERVSTTDARSRPSSRDRASPSEARSRPGSRERTNADTNSRPTSWEKTSNSNADSRVRLEVVDENAEITASPDGESTNDHQSASSKKIPRKLAASAQRLFRNDKHFPSAADLARPAKMVRLSASSIGSSSQADQGNQEKDSAKVPTENFAKDSQGTGPVNVPEKSKATDSQNTESLKPPFEDHKDTSEPTSGPSKPENIEGKSNLKNSHSNKDTKISEKSVPVQQPGPQPPPSSTDIFTVDIPLSFDCGVPRLQTPKVITPRRSDTKEEDGHAVQELKSLRPTVIILNKRYEGEGKAWETDADAASPDTKTEGSRSLVAMTAEENFKQTHSHAPRPSSSPGCHTDSGHRVEKRINQSTSKNHSQEAQPQSASAVTNGGADQINEGQGSQPASSQQSRVDQSILKDGAASSTTSVKNSGGKLPAPGSGPANVVASGGAEKNDASEPQKGSSKVRGDGGKNASVKSKDSEEVLKNLPRFELDLASDSSNDVAGSSGSSDGLLAQSTSLRGDVLVEGLLESARSNAGDKTSIPPSPDNGAMPFQVTPRGSSLSAVEVPEGTISTVSLAVSKGGTGGARSQPMRDQPGASGGIFDRFTSSGSLWQKARGPLVVKPSTDPYSREPREYEDYLPREPKRPVLQRRSSLGKIVVQDTYDKSYYYDDDYGDNSRQNALSRIRESRGSQTVRVKNQEPRHGILKKTETRPLPRKEDSRSTLKEKLEDYRDTPPIIIASGLVPKNLESLTSEYQAAHAGQADDGMYMYNSAADGYNGAANQHPNGNNGYYTNGNGSYNASGNVTSYGPGGGNGSYNTMSNVPYGMSGGNPYNSYPTNGSNRMGSVPGGKNYPAKDRDQFHERYLDPPSGAPVTAPLVASQQKQNIGDVFERLHSNRRAEHSSTTGRKPDLKPKPKTVPAKARDSGITSAAAKGTAAHDPQRRQPQGTGNDVFSRLYQNAPSRKRRDEVGEQTRLLDVPASNTLQARAASPPVRKDSVKGSPRVTKDFPAAPGHARRDTVLNMPLLAPDIVVDEVGEPTPIHRERAEYGMEKAGGGSDTIPIVLLQGFFRGPGARSPHHRRPSVTVSELTLPPHLVDVTSVIRGALPVLPRSLAALCLTLNIVLPGLGTAASGWLGLCWGRNRLGTVETSGHRFTSVVVTAVTGFVQLFTVTFFLVGWFWGVAWGILLVSIANKYAHFISEHRTSLTGAVSLEMLTVNAN